MQVLRNTEYSGGRFTNVFVGYGLEESHQAIELTYNWDQSKAYERGDAWEHLAITVPDFVSACERYDTLGVKIVRSAGPMKNGTRMLAFIEDPDGYRIELNEPLS